MAEEAEFFSFGTNDLTQLTFGFSRDDVGKFLRVYQKKKILERDPFASIDTVGVGQLVRMGVEKGREARARPQARHLRRARRRPGVDPLLRERGARLRELLAVPRAGGPAGGGAGGAGGASRRLADGRGGRRARPVPSWRTVVTIFVHRDGRDRTRDRDRPRLAGARGRDAGLGGSARSVAHRGARAERHRSRSTRWRSRMPSASPASEGRELRRLPLPHPPRHRLPRPPSTASGRTESTSSSGRTTSSRCTTARRGRCRSCATTARATTGAAGRGAGGADAPHHRRDGRPLHARGREARGAARRAGEGRAVGSASGADARASWS